jgi:putative membrane protein
MFTIAVRILITAFALILVAKFIPGITVTGLYPALIAALILGILNVLVRPILVILTLPITLLTLGLFIFVINALLFWFVASFVDGFKVDGFIPALLGSLIVSIVSSVINKFPNKD